MGGDGDDDLRLQVDKKGNFKLRAIEAVIGQLRLTEYFDAVPDKERIEVAVQENER
jgi:hypothetical protein